MTLPAVYQTKEPWTRQPCDSEASWVAFVVYRDMPPPRTIPAVCTRLGRKFTYAQQLYKWSQEHYWPERVLEYDRHTDAVKRKAAEKLLEIDARIVAAEHVDDLRRMRQVASHAVGEYFAKVRNGERLDWSPRDTIAVLEKTIVLERLVRGQSTEHVLQGSFDLSKLSDGELEQYRELLLKAGAGDE